MLENYNMEECKKIKLTEQEADATLRRAVEGQFKPWSKAKIVPSRKYECPKCGEGVYHLSSKSSITIY